MLDRMLRHLTLATSICLSLPAQTSVISGICSPASPQFDAPASPLAGHWFNLDVSSSLVSGQPGPFLHVTLIGFSDPAASLPSCGCTIHASLDIVIPQVPVSMVPYAYAWANSTWFVLPASATGITFYTQAIALHQPGTASTCSEFFGDFGVSRSLQVTVL